MVNRTLRTASSEIKETPPECDNLEIIFFSLRSYIFLIKENMWPAECVTAEKYEISFTVQVIIIATQKTVFKRRIEIE